LKKTYELISGSFPQPEPRISPCVGQGIIRLPKSSGNYIYRKVLHSRALQLFRTVYRSDYKNISYFLKQI